MPGTGVSPLGYGAAAPNNKPLASTQDGPDVSGFKQEGRASWYGRFFSGRRTASGERFDMHALTAAHKTLPLASYVRVTNMSNDKSVVVKINDRGPYAHGRIIDLSYAAARKLGFHLIGTTHVKIEGLTQEEAKAEQRGDMVAADAVAKGEPQP
jgi:rare lipoprotein A